MDAKGQFMALLLLDEIVVGSKFLEHVGHDHAAAVGFVEKVRELLALGAIREAQAEHGVRLYRQPCGLAGLLPEILVALTSGPDPGHDHLLAGKLATLAPSLKLGVFGGLSGCHLKHEV